MGYDLCTPFPCKPATGYHYEVCGLAPEGVLEMQWLSSSFLCWGFHSDLGTHQESLPFPGWVHYIRKQATLDRSQARESEIVLTKEWQTSRQDVFFHLPWNKYTLKINSLWDASQHPPGCCKQQLLVTSINMNKENSLLHLFEPQQKLNANGLRVSLVRTLHHFVSTSLQQDLCLYKLNHMAISPLNSYTSQHPLHIPSGLPASPHARSISFLEVGQRTLRNWASPDCF